MLEGLYGTIIHIVIATIIIGPVLWLAGRALVGGQRARFTDGLWIAALGTIIGDVLGYFLPSLGLVLTIILIIIWLVLIKHFFDCGWLKALLIAIVAIIIFIIIAAILAFLGFVAFSTYIPHFV